VFHSHCILHNPFPFLSQDFASLAFGSRRKGSYLKLDQVRAVCSASESCDAMRQKGEKQEETGEEEKEEGRMK